MNKKIILSIIGILIIGGLGRSPLWVAGQYQDIDAEIEILNQQIISQKSQIEALKAKQAEYQEQIKLKQGEKSTLNNQLAIINDRLLKAEIDIDSANLEIDKTNLEIRKVEIDGLNIDAEIETRKQHLASLLKQIYKQDQISTLEILLLNDSLAEFLNQFKNLEDTSREINLNVTNLQLDKERLEKNKQELKEKTQELAALRKKLEDKKDDLVYEQINKAFILEETKSSEQAYQALLTKAQRDQEQAKRDIANAEVLIRKKLSEKDQNKLNAGPTDIAWPVPKNVITASFRDASYPYAHLIGEHSAVDIRAGQGTTIRAAADGYVAKVKFEGNSNYAYIMLIHGNSLSTVYGHVSAVLVAQDQFVVQGEPIGRTGGMPGGIGSGPFTTGPHLHFEVRKDGIPVNPENYLP